MRSSEAPVRADGLRSVLLEASRAVRRALDGLEDLRRPGRRPGQYHLDLVADEAVLEVLHGAGLAVLSEESGHTSPGSTTARHRVSASARGRTLLVVVDPVDGSTNASLGLPWYATSLCVLDDTGPLVGLVVNQATGACYEAVRGGGARRDGRPVRPSSVGHLEQSVIGISGFPRTHPGWAQFRAMGAAALDLCAVAEGVLDGYRVVGGSRLFAWDYLAAMLVCTEAGATVGECDGAELIVRDASPRRPVAAGTPALYGQIFSAAL